MSSWSAGVLGMRGQRAPRSLWQERERRVDVGEVKRRVVGPVVIVHVVCVTGENLVYCLSGERNVHSLVGRQSSHVDGLSAEIRLERRVH